VGLKQFLSSEKVGIISGKDKSKKTRNLGVWKNSSTVYLFIASGMYLFRFTE
jgi:hypothetical protein